MQTELGQRQSAAAAAPRRVQKPAIPARRRAKALFLLAAGLSFIFSVSLWFLVDREQGLFVGIWVPSILALGALILSPEEAPRG